MLEELRIKKGLTQQQLAEKIGRNKSCISRLETGKTKSVTIELVVRLAEELEMDKVELFLIFANIYIENRKVDHEDIDKKS